MTRNITAKEWVAGELVDANDRVTVNGVLPGSGGSGLWTQTSDGVLSPAAGQPVSVGDLQFDSAPATGVSAAISEGTVYADDGNVYDTAQAAQDAATDYIQLGPGTFSTFNVNTAGLTVQGSGRGTLVDGGSGRAITVGADNVTISNLAAQNTPEGGTASVIHGDTSLNSAVHNVTIPQAEKHAIWTGKGWNITGCTIEDASNNGNGVYITHPHVKVMGCDFRGAIEGKGITGAGTAVARMEIIGNVFDSLPNTSINTDGPGCIVLGNVVLNSGFTAIYVMGDNSMVGFNRATGTDGVIKVYGTNDIIANNRVTSIDTTNATTPTMDANIEG